MNFFFYFKKFLVIIFYKQENNKNYTNLKSYQFINLLNIIKNIITIILVIKMDYITITPNFLFKSIVKSNKNHI